MYRRHEWQVSGAYLSGRSARPHPAPSRL